MFTSNFLHENSKLIFYVYVRDEPRSCCFVVMNICERERERERERYEPFMLETAFLTLLSQPSQSIFTLISTVCNTRKKNNNKTIRFYMDIKSYQRNQYHTCTNTHRKI
jgi:hypothetical protein